MQNEVNVDQFFQDQQADTAIPSLDHLQADLFKFMTQYSVQPCEHLASHIVQVLQNLCSHPHIELLPEQRTIYCQSLNLWRAKLMPQTAATSRLIQ